MNLTKYISLIFAITCFVSCKHTDTSKSVDSTNITNTNHSQKDIYINREFYAGDELEDVEVLKTETTHIDSISYSLYKIRGDENYIFSLERFLKNDDVKKFIILDIVNLKSSNISLEFENRLSKTILSLIQKDKRIKKWEFKNKPKAIGFKIVHTI